LKDRPVQPPAVQRSFLLEQEGLPELGQQAAAVLDDICSQMIDQGFHVPSANYFGLTNPTPTYMAVLAEALVAALNPQLASLARSQLSSRIEQQTLGWIAERVGWHQNQYGGTFTSGGTEANLSALAIALTQRYPHAADSGLVGLGEQPVVYASAEAHHSLEKSLGLLGLGRKALRRIPVNEAAEIDVHALELAIATDRKGGFEPLAIVGTAGTTSSGAVDPLPALAALARQQNLWFHVDGAFGAAVLFSDQHRALVEGIELADSITIDPHKWLAMPFAAGVLLTGHPQLLEPTFGLDTSYLPRAANSSLPDNFRVSAQWSRRMNSLKLWLTLRVHGRQSYEDLIDSQLRLASYMESRILETGAFDRATPRRLTILNFRARAARELALPEEEIARLHHSIAAEITQEGQQWISTTRVRGRSVLRMMVISYLTEQQHIDALATRLQHAAKTVLDRSFGALRSS
ncbi:MAG TPA: pyridoxal-dependent decarboxylase, partial [Acidobacteriaceae bacterium]|nr:pyridoxal-dependent decarboxylase [Acidobacteriaceae bacterium]